jgi:hypothetical protein
MSRWKDPYRTRKQITAYWYHLRWRNVGFRMGSFDEKGNANTTPKYGIHD